MAIRPVRVDGTIVINRGADAFGKIAEIEKGKSWGRKGEFYYQDRFGYGG